MPNVLGTIISVAGYGDWNVYFDGQEIGADDNWRTAKNITVIPTYGKHNITFVVVKKDTATNSIAGLDFLIQQDTSQCKCETNGF